MRLQANLGPTRTDCSGPSSLVKVGDWKAARSPRTPEVAPYDERPADDDPLPVCRGPISASGFASGDDERSTGHRRTTFAFWDDFADGPLGPALGGRM